LSSVQTLLTKQVSSGWIGVSLRFVCINVP
jgi:hypothetical protein